MFLLSLLPMLLLVSLLIIFKRPSIQAAPLCLLVVVLLAYFVWDMDAHLIFLAGMEGFVYTLWPIGIIMFAALSLTGLQPFIWRSPGNDPLLQLQLQSAGSLHVAFRNLCESQS